MVCERVSLKVKQLENLIFSHIVSISESRRRKYVGYVAHNGENKTYR
jgi:hypothetical protein